ncbi:MAG: RNA ligase [Halanaeroarchaeum sp.]
MDVADLLGVPPDEVADLLEHFERDTYEGTVYRRLPDARHGIERGTVLVDGTAVRGFPSIPRTLVLETGVPAFFDGPFAVEEKLNGFNVRVAQVGRPLAFTRGGIVGPFATRMARDLLDLEAFFADHPEKMLCTEFIGPENPYTAHDYPGVDSVAVRVFDVRDRVSGRPLAVEERRSLVADYDFPQPERFATLDPEDGVDRLRAIVDRLDAAGREGVVMQSADGRDLLKYTTGSQHADDLAFAFSLPFDYGRDFVFSRLIREGFQAVEWEESPEELADRAHRIGEAILYPMVETIRAVRDGDPVGERHTIRASPETVEATLDHLRQQGIGLEILTDRSVGEDERVVEFLKITDATRDSIAHYLEGGTIDE